jgi:hypothetical protein
MALWIQTCLVDIYDSYDQFNNKVVDESHLNIRRHLIKSGIMETKMGIPTWVFWKRARDKEFLEWFKIKVFVRVLDQESGTSNEFNKLNMVRK